MKRPNVTSIRAGVMLVIICLIATGCVLMEMRKKFGSSLNSTGIIGRVYGEFTEKGPIVVAACSADNKMEIAGYTVVHGSGEYELAVEHGNYFVFAFQDKNSNLIYDPGEPAGQHGAPKLVRARAVGVVFDIDINVPQKGDKIVIAPGTEISSIRPQKLYSHQAGVIADLDDERFSEAHGIEGFWEYTAFFRELGAISISSKNTIPQRYRFCLSTVPPARPKAGSILSIISTEPVSSHGSSITRPDAVSIAWPTCCSGN